MAYVTELSKTVFLVYNSDLSGMSIQIWDKKTDFSPKHSFDIDHNELLNVFVNHLKNEKISEIESMDNKKFIKKFML